MTDPRHLTFTFDAEVELTAAADPAGSSDSGRKISGLIVPYDVEAELGYFGRVEFAPGSITFAGRVPMLLGHDSNRPVGVLAEQIDSSSGLYGTFRIDPTPDGDSALAQATSGSRAGLSIGADIVEFESLESGELTRVTKAKVTETSLVSLAAFDTAAVDAVAAAKSTRKDRDMSEEHQTDAEAAKAAEAAAAAAERELEPDERPNRAERVPVLVAEADRPAMRFGDYIKSFIAAERGDAAARARIEAALTRETLGSNPGVVPVAYAGALVDSLGADRPLYLGFSRAELPPSGMTVRRPAMTTRPDGGWMADDTAGAVSGPVVIGNMDVPVQQWSWGGSASVALVERSAPSYIEEVFTAAIKSYYRDVEALIAGKLTTVAASSATSLGEAVGDYLTTTRTYPNLAVAGAQAYGMIIDALGLLRYASGSVDATGEANLAGLRVIPSADVAAADLWVTHSDYIETRESAPIRLSVSDVTSLSLEIGVTSFATCLDKVVTNGAVRLGGFTPAAAEQAAGKSSKK